MKKIVYVDMDGVLADFWGGVGDSSPRIPNSDPPAMFEKGFFFNLEPTPGSKEAIATLLQFKGLSVYIASKPSTKNLWSTIEKYQWLQVHFPDLFQKVFLTCDKGHLNGDYLIDDDVHRWKPKFKGKFLHFNELKPEESWKWIVEYLSQYK